MIAKALFSDEHEAKPLDETHEAEKAERGWSRLEIMGYGADKTLIPELAGVLLKSADHENIIRLATEIETLQFDSIEISDDIDTIIKWEDRRHNVVKNALAELSKYPALLIRLRNDEGRSPISVLGNAIVYFSVYTIGYPARGEYAETSDNEAYFKWRSECKKHGEALMGDDEKSVLEAFVWLSEYYSDLWD